MSEDTRSADPPIEGALPAVVPTDVYKLRLFITGSTPRSTRAIESMRKICEEKLKGRYDLEVIDVYQNPEATRELQIVATPTLVKILPEPLRRIIGDLSDHERVLAGLNIQPIAIQPLVPKSVPET